MHRPRLVAVAGLVLVVASCTSSEQSTPAVTAPRVFTTPSPTTTTTTTEPVGIVTIDVRLDRRTTDLATATFDDVVRSTLRDDRGWRRAGFIFGFTDDAALSIVLAEADEVDRLCLPYDTGGRFSCQNGPIVALNADRWRTATDTWTGTLAEYRQMLVNHEVGHLLGRHHAFPGCEPGEPAAVMFQQSGGLGECEPNPWPLPWEIACAARFDEPIAPPYEVDAVATCGPVDV